MWIWWDRGYRRALGCSVAALLLMGSGCARCDSEAAPEEDASSQADTQGEESPAASAPAEPSSSAMKRPNLGKLRSNADKLPGGDLASPRELKGGLKDPQPLKLAGSAPGVSAPAASAPAASAPSASAPAPEPATFALDGALTAAAVKTATGYKGGLRSGPLPGIDADATYNALRLRSSSPGRFGVGLQVWRLSNPGQQTRRFNDLMRQYGTTERTRDLGDSAFKAGWSGMRYFVWLDRKANYLAALSCDDTLCKDDGAVLSLARETADKLPAALTP